MIKVANIVAILIIPLTRLDAVGGPSGARSGAPERPLASRPVSP